jgi:hypothetical protein
MREPLADHVLSVLRRAFLDVERPWNMRNRAKRRRLMMLDAWP